MTLSELFSSLQWFDWVLNSGNFLHIYYVILLTVDMCKVKKVVEIFGSFCLVQGKESFDKMIEDESEKENVKSNRSEQGRRISLLQGSSGQLYTLSLLLLGVMCWRAKLFAQARSCTQNIRVFEQKYEAQKMSLTKKFRFI